MSNQKVHSISDYALIGNCRTGALVSNEGSLDWCCFPRFDSASYFARLLDPAGGHFSLSPTGNYDSEQSYLESTNVLKTQFTTKTGTATLTDFFSLREESHFHEGLWPDQEILRIVEAQEGEIEWSLEFVPKAQYGLEPIQLKRIGNWGIQCNHGQKLLLFQTTLPNSLLKLDTRSQERKLTATFKLKRGERALFSLSYSQEAPAIIPFLGTALERRDQTIRFWKNWAGHSSKQGLHTKRIERSALTLKLLHFSPSGAFIAAPTTSLPENPGGTRNWDYRFCWLRDASFTTRALLSLGYMDEAKSFLNWLLHSTRLTWPKLQVVYSIFGESKIKEKSVPWLSGYQGSKPVRIGNEASTQTQLDIYGEVIDSFFSLSKYLHPIDRETKKMVIGFGQTVAERWRKPDRGIWEFRDQERHFTHSKVMCWVAMDRLARLSKRFHWRLPYDAKRISEEIKEIIEAKAYDSKLGSYTRSFGEPILDASVLVMPLVGYCDANSPRFQTTRDAIIQQLSQNDFVYRYAPASDGFPEPEGAFVVCNFWLAEALAKAGLFTEANRWFEAIARHLPSTNLASEEIDPVTRKFLGNHPQAFSHIGLINAAMAIHELEKNQPDIRRQSA